MIEWTTFENKLYNKPYYTINNKSKKNIVLFGSCQVATIGFMLNELLNYQYNIRIVISWFFEKNGVENFDMNYIRKKIKHIINNCDIFIYHYHVYNYSINANIINKYVRKEATTILIPNMKLQYSFNNEQVAEANSIYMKSLKSLTYTILHSDLNELIFVPECHRENMFFNTNEHPTHFILFLIANAIINRIFNLNKIINISDYKNINNRLRYKDLNNYVILPGRIVIDEKIHNITGILQNADYFD
jgi:hypothetical protein